MAAAIAEPRIAPKVETDRKDIYPTGQPIPVEWTEPDKDETWQSKSRREAHNKERLDQWAGLSCQEKTQMVADLRWTTGKKWRVSLPKDKVHPTVVIRANGPEEASWRYNQVCGITSTEHTHQIEPVEG